MVSDDFPLRPPTRYPQPPPPILKKSKFPTKLVLGVIATSSLAIAGIVIAAHTGGWIRGVAIGTSAYLGASSIVQTGIIGRILQKERKERAMLDEDLAKLKPKPRRSALFESSSD